MGALHGHYLDSRDSNSGSHGWRQELYPLSHLSSSFPIFLVQLDLLYLYSYIHFFKLPMNIILLTNSSVKHCPARKTSWELYPAYIYGRALYLSQECWEVGAQ